jgi:hypothetical protein
MATKLFNFRLSPADIGDIEALKEHWGADDRTQTLRLAIRIAKEATGLAKADAVDAVLELERQFGSDAQLAARLAEAPNATVHVGGKPVDAWSAAYMVWGTQTGESGETVASGALVNVRHDPTGSLFALELRNPRLGGQVSVRVGDLVEHLVLRTAGKDEGEMRRSIRHDFEIRRRLRAAMGDTDFDINPDNEEPPLDDDAD